MHSQSAVGLMHFSTDDVPERDRVAYWRDFFGAKLIKIEVEPLDRRNFRQTNTVLSVPDLDIAFGTTTGHEGRRTPALVADGNDNFLLIAQLAGKGAVLQLGRQLDMAENQAMLGSMADVGFQAFRQPARYLNIGMPRRVLQDRARDVEDSLMRLMREDNGALRLLLDYVALTLREHTPLDAHLQQAFATHIHDLVGLAIGATRDGALLAQRRGVRAARLSAMKADIMAHLREEGLSVQDVARRHGVTPRYVQLLFDDDGRTFSEFVVEQRLT